MKIHDIMTANPSFVTPDATIREAAQVMKRESVGIVPVIQGQGDRTLIGVVTDRDIVTRVVAEGKNPMAYPAEICMSQPVATVTTDASLSDVVAMMEKHQIRRVPVVDERGCCGKADERSIESTVFAWRPRSSRTGTHSMIAPSGTLLRPCSRRTLKWSRTSPSTSSLTRKPKPRVASNHFTRPVIGAISGTSADLSDVISVTASPAASFAFTRVTMPH